MSNANRLRRRQRYGTAFGILFILIGIPGLVLPFIQGAIFIIVGIGLLSLFSPRAGRVIGKWKMRYPYFAIHLDRGENRVEQFLRRLTHQTHRAKIEGRDRRKLSVLVDERREAPPFIAIVMHGLGGYKEQPLLRGIADAFCDHGGTVVRFDCANSVGESSGTYASGSATSFLADLTSVIDWIDTQAWKAEVPVILSGHSLGGLCVFEYAMQFPSRVQALVGIGSVISGALSKEAYQKFDPDGWGQWQGKGYRIDQVPVYSPRNRLPFAHMQDRLQYDLTKRSDLLLMPTLMFVGENDQKTPLAHQQELYVRLIGDKKLVVIPGAGHMPSAHADLALMKSEISTFLETHFPTTQ